MGQDLAQGGGISLWMWHLFTGREDRLLGFFEGTPASSTLSYPLPHHGKIISSSTYRKFTTR